MTICIVCGEEQAHDVCINCQADAMEARAAAPRNQEMKADDGKLMLELIPPSAIFAIGRVMTYGAKKYKPHGWKDVEPERYVGALQRHLYSWLYGVERDQESGLLHLEQVLCNAAFLVELTKGRCLNG